LVYLLFLSLVNARDTERTVEDIRGTVVAYDDVTPWVTCINRCETSLIVLIDKVNDVQPHYVRVDLTFSERGKFPGKLIIAKRHWQFKVIRTPERDKKIEEFILGQDVYGKDFKNPIWRIVPGSEGEKLPFGEVLRSYSLLKNGFKLAEN
jgi:hypothetical protein